MENKQIQKTQPMHSIDEVWKMANFMHRSNMFGINDPNQAMSIMLISQAEGLHPAIAARDYHIIKNRPTLKADAILARHQQGGGTVEWKTYTDENVTAIFTHPSGGKVEIEWTFARAKKIGLTKNNVWNQYPRNMLRSRCISEGVKTVNPGVCCGVYTPEEVMDMPPSKPIKTNYNDVSSEQPKIEEKKVEVKTLTPKEVFENKSSDLKALMPSGEGQALVDEMIASLGIDLLHFEDEHYDILSEQIDTELSKVNK